MLKQSDIITVLGGSGFLGSYVVHHLARKGVRIKVVSRNAESMAKEARVSGAVGQIAFLNRNLRDVAQLEEVIKGSDYVINLVGTFTKGAFEAMHVTLPTNIAKLCQKHKVQKLIHISALGIEQAVGTSKYASTKIHGEQAVIDNLANHVIIKPGAMFGLEDHFINMLMQIVKVSPIVPLIGGGHNKMQPVFVDDVALAIVKCLEINLPIGKRVLELAGPRKYTMKQLWQLVNKALGVHRVFVTIPFFFAKIQAFFLQMLPNPLLTTEQVELLKHHNILNRDNGFDMLEIQPKTLEIFLPKYKQQ
jgi:NADH dehydrogenase